MTRKKKDAVEDAGNGVESSVDAEQGAKTEEVETIDTDGKGNTFLPGTEPVVVKSLIEKARDIELNLKPAFASARNALVLGKEQLAEIAHNNLQHFTKNQETGEYSYKAAGVEIRIIKEKEVIKTKIEDDDDDV